MIATENLVARFMLDLYSMNIGKTAQIQSVTTAPVDTRYPRLAITTVGAHVPSWPQAVDIGRQMTRSPMMTVVVESIANTRVHQIIMRWSLTTAIRRSVAQIELLRNRSETQ